MIWVGKFVIVCVHIIMKLKRYNSGIVQCLSKFRTLEGYKIGLCQRRYILTYKVIKIDCAMLHSSCHHTHDIDFPLGVLALLW